MRKRGLILLYGFALSLAMFVFVAKGRAQAGIYEVGPGKPFASIGDVPWESLQPGDTVLIYWRSTPYKEKWVICRQGTQSAPITVRGVAGPEGQLPVIDGNGATTRRAINFWSESRGLIKIGGANIPADTMPKFITIEKLEIIRPGKPTVFARRGMTYFFGLPGNPVSTSVTFNVFARPAIRKMQGESNPLLPTVQAVLARAVKDSSSRRSYLPARLIIENGRAVAEPLKWGGSSDLVAFMQSGALIIVREETHALAEGEVVDVFLLNSFAERSPTGV